jgi:hypothetical protein
MKREVALIIDIIYYENFEILLFFYIFPSDYRFFLQQYNYANFLLISSLFLILLFLKDGIKEKFHNIMPL